MNGATSPYPWRSIVVLGIAAALSVSGCASHQANPSLASQPPRPSERLLRERAQRLWAARTAQDWPTVFQFQSSDVRTSHRVDDFRRWSEENDPFRVLSFTIDDVQTDAQRGWVRVHYRSGLTRFPKADPSDAETWQKWVVVDGDWYPVPPKELDAHPDSPALRDRGEEARLEKRFLAACEARKRRDWSTLYSLCDPNDRLKVSEEQVAAAESLAEFLACSADWVEVINDRGRVRAAYEYRLSDPSLSKLPPETSWIIEPWSLVDGEWYRDLERPVK